MGEDEITFYAKQRHATTSQMLVNVPGTGILKETDHIISRSPDVLGTLWQRDPWFDDSE